MGYKTATFKAILKMFFGKLIFTTKQNKNRHHKVMEKFIAWVCIIAIALLAYGMFLIFYALEQKKLECEKVWLMPCEVHLGG